MEKNTITTAFSHRLTTLDRLDREKVYVEHLTFFPFHIQSPHSPGFYKSCAIFKRTPVLPVHREG